MDVLHVDAVVAKILHDNGAREHRLIKDGEVVKEWSALLGELGACFLATNAPSRHDASSGSASVNGPCCSWRVPAPATPW